MLGAAVIQIVFPLSGPVATWALVVGAVAGAIALVPSTATRFCALGLLILGAWLITDGSANDPDIRWRATLVAAGAMSLVLAAPAAIVSLRGRSGTEPRT